MRTAAVLLLLISTAALARAEPDPAPADKAVLSQLAPGTDYVTVVKLLGPPNAVEKIADGAQQLVYTGNRAPIKQHVGFLFFGWTRESPGAAYRTVVTLRNNVVESLTSN